MLFVTFQRLTVTKTGLLTNIKSFNRLYTTFKLPDKNTALISSRFLTNKYKFSLKPQRNIYTSISGQLYSVKGIQENISALHMKKRPLRKKRNITEDDDTIIPGFWNVKSLATADEYDLERLMDGLIKQDLYFPEKICTSSKYIT